MNAAPRPRPRLLAVLVAIVAAVLVVPSGSAVAARGHHSQVAKVVVTGEVQRRHLYTVTRLRAFPQHTVTVQFASGTGIEQHTFTGPLLIDVATASAPHFDSSVKNDQLRFFVAATGTDGYRAIVSWGEIDPAFGARQVLLATAQDGTPLDTVGPRLIVPGDAKGGRYVSAVDQIHIGDVDHLVHQ